MSGILGVILIFVVSVVLFFGMMEVHDILEFRGQDYPTRGQSLWALAIGLAFAFGVFVLAESCGEEIPPAREPVVAVPEEVLGAGETHEQLLAEVAAATGQVVPGS